MTLKQFLKPDWRKIVVFLIIIFIILMFVGIPIYGETQCMIGAYPTECPVYISVVSINDFLECKEFGKCGQFFAYEYFILELVISYLLSCLIIWFYERFRK